jgi:hypothetical protein
MVEDPSPLLQQAGIDTLEKLAFLFAFPDEERQAPGEGGCLAARVRFSGPFDGQLAILMALGALPELAANMLGIEGEEATPEAQQDALREALNVICGNLLPAWAGAESLFNIQPPEILDDRGLAALLERPGRRAVARLALDGGWCDLLLFGPQEAP